MVYKRLHDWVTHIGIYGAEDLECKHCEVEGRGTFFTVLGQEGGLHLRLMDDGEDSFYGGLEYHHPVTDPADKPNYHESCWLLDRPCKHEGSSLIVEEYFGPLWKQVQEESIAGGHRLVLERLIKIYTDAFDVYHEDTA